MHMSGFLGGLLNPLLNSWLACLVVALLIAPIIPMNLARLLEHRPLPMGKGQASSYKYGDCLILPAGLAYCAFLTQYLPERGFWNQWWWPWLTLLIAVIHVDLEILYLDGPKYTRAQMLTPTKLWHNVMVYGVELWLVLTVGIPTLTSGWEMMSNAAGVYAFMFMHLPQAILLVSFFLMLMLDAEAEIRGKLDCNYLHPAPKLKKEVWLIALGFNLRGYFNSLRQKIARKMRAI